jgi:hypothetical protein
MSISCQLYKSSVIDFIGGVERGSIPLGGVERGSIPLGEGSKGGRYPPWRGFKRGEISPLTLNISIIYKSSNDM